VAVSFVTAHLSPFTVVAAGCATLSVFLGLTFYVWLSPHGFNPKWACLIVLLAALICFGLIFAFLTDNFITASLCSIQALVIGIYLACAILVVVDKNGMACDDYIFGSVMIYAVGTM